MRRKNYQSLSIAHGGKKPFRRDARARVKSHTLDWWRKNCAWVAAWHGQKSLDAWAEVEERGTLSAAGTESIKLNIEAAENQGTYQRMGSNGRFERPPEGVARL